MTSNKQLQEHNLIELEHIGIKIADSLTLQKISRRLHQLDEAACNYGLTPRQEKRETRLEKEADNIAKRYGMIAYHQSDPRGWSLRVGPETALRGYAVDANYTALTAVCSR